jgi:uncharacterized membrane protein HdeD (DUF308 family)
MRDETMWGVGVFEGILAILFGIAAVFWPGLTITTLLYLFAAFVLVGGLINMVEGVFSIGRTASSWFLRILLGVLQLGVGVYLLRHPKVTFTTFILLIGFTLIFRGVFELVIAFADRMTATNRVLLLMAGGLALIAGIVILFQPVSGGVAFVWLLGLYALITGPIMVAVALDARKLAR